LTASPQAIQRGQSSPLTWQTQNATDVTIDPIGKVAERGSQTVTTSESTTYKLTAKGSGSAGPGWEGELPRSPAPHPHKQNVAVYTKEGTPVHLCKQEFAGTENSLEETVLGDFVCTLHHFRASLHCPATSLTEMRPSPSWLRCPLSSNC